MPETIEKKEVANSGKTVTLLNRGKRSYDLGQGADGQPRRHVPGAMMVYSAEEAARMSGYTELVDISKLPGQIDVSQLKTENVNLQAENAALKAQLEALEPKLTALEPKKEAEVKEGGRRSRATAE